MPQFPDSYEGPLVAENGSGTFVFGMGDYSAAPKGQTKLMLAVGSQQLDAPVSLAPATWRHAAVTVEVTGSARVHRVFVDGAQVGSSLTFPSSNSPATGTLRVGKRTSGMTVNGRNGQFYGLVDDVGVFTRRLSAQELAALASADGLTGKEPDLLAGVAFRPGRRRATLGATTSLHGAARIVATSPDRDSQADAASLPLPTAHEPMDLPFPPGEAWKVIQGVDFQGGSHQGYACFCWDFVVADHPQAGEYPDGSDGAPFYAAAPGTVVTVRESAPSGTSQSSNYVEVEQATDEYCAYLHLRQDTALPKVGDHVAAGALLALTGDTGVEVGAHHPHVAVTDAPDQTPGFVTFPVAFRDYQVRSGDDNWTDVARGMPLNGQVVRNPPTPTFHRAGLSVASVVARSPNDLDVVATDASGRAWRTHWTPGRYDANWDRWRPVLGDIATPGTPPSLVSLDPHRLDVFASSSDGRTFTGAWDDRVASGVWRGWWNIQTGHIVPGGAVTAVSRAPNKLDVFHVSNDGHIYTAAWDHHVADGKWRGWWRIGNLKAKPGSPVSVVARDDHKLDIFVASADGTTWTAAWDRDAADGTWRGWWNIQTGHIPAGGTVTAVSRAPNKLDVFHVSNDGGIYTAAWDNDVADSKWRGWWRIGNLKAKPGAPVSVVARDDHKLDVFVAGADGKTWTAAWDRDAADGTWRGWWNIQTGHIRPGSAVAAVSRAPTKLDIFIVSKDNQVYTAAWDHHVADGTWRGWWKIG